MATFVYKYPRDGNAMPPPCKHANASEQEGKPRAREGERRRGKTRSKEGEEERRKEMAADIGYYWLVAIPVRVVLGVVLAVITLVVIVVVAFIVFVCATNFRAWWRSPRMRLLRLGGVTTLRRSLSYPCTICRDSMEAGEKVRTLSCDHVFHCGGTVKCGFGIDAWLLAGDAMSWQSCPNCRQVPHPVLPWKRPPPSSPAPSSPQTSDSDSEEELLFPSHWFDETLPE
ncbi:hypothetical protein BDA96_06G142900 [Sorghum bicolor]|nr:E3 ubiquitin-protein ligase RNF13 [Sorghum bicolor]KAG0526403.1 hypothetical protein BDA96_06G142900 [Sorghum bicolor]|eukprot:XP_021319289.1 E3 ubiquitin-protein ligase RNF13 [Sorghum bicolor]